MAAPVEDIPAPPSHNKPEPPEYQPKHTARRGRPPKAAEPKPATTKAAPVKADYTSQAQALVGSVWTVAASVPPTQAFAFVLNNNADALASALAAGAKSNEAIRNFVDGGGDAGWKLQLAAVTVSMGMQTMSLMKDQDLRAQAAEHTRAQLSEAMKAHGIVPEEAPSGSPGNV
jgi:hypothetical protein